LAFNDLQINKMQQDPKYLGLGGISKVEQKP